MAELRPRRLSGLVESIWYFEGTTPHARERHFPHGLFELVVQLDHRVAFVKNGVRKLNAGRCLVGLQTDPTSVEAPPRPSSVLDVRLHTAGAYALVAIPLYELTDRLVDLDDLLGRGAIELAESCDGARGAERGVQCAADWLSALLRALTSLGIFEASPAP